MPLAYHLDEEIRTAFLGVGVPLVVLLAVVGIALAIRLPQGDGGNPTAVRALVLALIGAPAFFFFGLFLSIFLVGGLLPLAVFLYAIAAVRRVPQGGRKAEALLAFGASGLSTVYVVASTIACVAVDGCLH